ncbi:MAG: hypothetical protein ACRD5F_09435, partial [Candidatus Acidiferrales bacterium]
MKNLRMPLGFGVNKKQTPYPGATPYNVYKFGSDKGDPAFPAAGPLQPVGGSQHPKVGEGMSVQPKSLLSVLALGLMVSVAGSTSGSHAPDSPKGPRRFSLSNGVSMNLPGNWVEQRERGIPPPQLLQVAAPDIQFTEFLAWENREGASLAQLASSSNPFFGSDARTLDVRMHQANSLANHFFFFFFPPPDSCLAQARAAYREEKARREAAQLEEAKRDRESDRKHFV